MTKAKTTLICLLFGLTVLYPVGSLLAACLGYSFELKSMAAFVITIALLSVGLVVLDLACKNVLENKSSTC